MMMKMDADQVALLTPAQMSEADRLTILNGTKGWTLMQRAGQGVFDALRSSYPAAGRIAILAGPGNNGGDAFVVAALCLEAGLQAIVFCRTSRTRAGGDVGRAAASFHGTIIDIGDFTAEGFDLVVDGLYGAGLSRAIEGVEARAIEVANASGLPILAIDLPSGVSGLSGTKFGIAVSAELTVTFFRRKPGHLLQPGRALCGRLLLIDIGIEADVLRTIAPETFANGPALWGDRFPIPSASGHKFDRGHAVVFSGSATKSGAARLSAMAALRVGAGLVTLASPPSALIVNAAHLTAIMLKRCSIPDDLTELLSDRRLGTFALGPGFGVGETARSASLAIIAAGRTLVLDADGITSFADGPEALFQAIKGQGSPVVLTPHAGEFARLFPDLAESPGLSKLERARQAAVRSGSVVILKGSDTVVAAPDGRAAINDTGTSYLATAGSGDVLSGLVAGLCSQTMPAFEAACAGVWLHGRAAELFGPGLIAEDLPGLIPRVLSELTDHLARTSQ